MTNCRYANVSDVQIHTEIHLCIVYIYIYVYLRHMHIRTHENVVPLPPLSLRLPCRFSSSCTSTPSFFCLALAPSRYSRRITELRTKIEGNGATAAAAFLLFSSVPSRSFYRVSNAFLDLSQKFRPHLRPIIGWIISI